MGPPWFFFFLFFSFFFWGGGGEGGGEPSYYIPRPVRTYNFFPSQSVINILTDNDQEYRCIRANRLTIGEHNRIAQLVEHCTGNAKVVGSNPVQSLNFFFSGHFSSSVMAAFAPFILSLLATVGHLLP